MKIVDAARHTIPTGETRSGTCVVLRLRTDTGLEGFGEAIVHGHGPTEAALEACAAVLVGVDAGHLNAVHRRLDEAGDLPATVRAAVDVAVHDLMAQARGVPVCTVLGGAYRTGFDLQATLEKGTPDEVARAARARVGEGVRSLRLPLPPLAERGLDETRRHILAVLDAVDGAAHVDLAAHGAWGSASAARAFLATLLDSALASHLAVVQPLHPLDLEGHAELRRSLPLPIVLEDAVVSATAMAQILKAGAADRVVVDLHRVGGLAEARRIADVCEAASIGVCVGGPSGTALSAAAHAHLAATVRDPLPVRIPAGHAASAAVLTLEPRPGLGIRWDALTNGTGVT